MNTNKQHKGIKAGIIYWFYQVAMVLFLGASLCV